MSLMGSRASCLALSDSMPGSAAAILRKSALILNPALALVSMNMTPYSRALVSPSSMDTCLRERRTERGGHGEDATGEEGVRASTAFFDSKDGEGANTGGENIASGGTRERRRNFSDSIMRYGRGARRSGMRRAWQLKQGSLSHRFSTRSVLLPTSMIMTSLPRSVLTSSIHLAVFKNEVLSANDVTRSVHTLALIRGRVVEFGSHALDTS